MSRRGAIALCLAVGAALGLLLLWVLTSSGPLTAHSGAEAQAARQQTATLPLQPLQVCLIPSADKNAVVVRLPALPGGSQYIVGIDTGQGYALAGNEFTWPIHGDFYNDSNLLGVYLVSEGQAIRKVGECEILRQAEGALEEIFSLTVGGGYLLLGRCTFDVASTEPSWSSSTATAGETIDYLTAVERDALRRMFPEVAAGDSTPDVSSEEAMATCARLLKTLYDHLPGLAEPGPSDTLEGITKPSAVAALLAARRTRVQCTGTRDLFLSVAISTGAIDVANIRKVDAFRYDPTPGIVVNSHSVLEVRAFYGKWVLFDPFYCLFLTDDQGRYLSASDVRDMRRRDELAFVRPHFVEGCRTGVELSPIEDTDRYNYNYWSQFELLRMTTLWLVDESSP